MTDKKELNNNDHVLPPEGHDITVSWLNIIVFFCTISILGILSLILPKDKISETEKRALCKFPTFSWHNLVEGDYTDSIELYYADNFPFREPMVQLASGTKDLYGYRSEDVMVYNIEKKDDNKKKIELEKAMQIDTTLSDSLAIAKLDSMALLLDTMKNGGEYVESVFIYAGKAFQMFGGSASTAKPFSNMVNLYRKTLPDVKIFCMEIPTPIDFYLPSKYKNKNNYEKPNIDLVYAALDSGITPVHAYEELQKNTDKYLYFNTDHHWTGLGGYYAYRAFCTAAGFQPYELTSLEKKTKKKFLGTLYSLTHDKRLKENIDSVEYFKLPVTTTCVYYLDEKSKKAYAAKLYSEGVRGPGSYGVFLGGDVPLFKITTPNKNGRRIMVIKDSYGNAFAPYLALHYEQVFVVDYRHFKSNIADFIKENKITDFIFAHNTFVVNTRYTSTRETALLKAYKGPAIPEKKEIVVDTATVKKDTAIIK
jgi:hypothetical protein